MSLSFSVIIPVLDEQDLINAQIDRLRVASYGRKCEIIVADGHPEQTTLTALTRQGVITLSAPQGRARQMNAGAALASGQVLVFLHADVLLPAAAFSAMEQVLADGSRVGGAFDLGIDSRKFPLRLIARLASLRSRLTRCPYGDQAIFLTREAFASLGGYADMPILEDVDLMRRARRAGMRSGFARGRAVCSPRRWDAEGIWRRTLGNWLVIVLYLLGVPAQKLAGLHPSRGQARTS